MCNCTSENLEISRCAIAHLWSGPSDHPRMTSLVCFASHTMTPGSYDVSRTSKAGHLHMVTTRPVRLDDLELICRHREEMFRASNAPGRSDEIRRAMTASF